MSSFEPNRRKSRNHYSWEKEYIKAVTAKEEQLLRIIEILFRNTASTLLLFSQYRGRRTFIYMKAIPNVWSLIFIEIETIVYFLYYLL